MILRGNARKASLLLALGLAVAAQGCTTYRILRYREPDARNQSVFPHRTVHKASAPFEFARASVLRNDLDTIKVRSPDGGQITWRQYMEDYAVLGFLVVRNDTIIYERYRDGLTAETVHSSFSVAKSVLSALLGAALADGTIKSLDQRVVELVPEVRKNPALEQVTLRNLFEMKSGLRYTEAEGSFLEVDVSDVGTNFD